MARIKGTTAQRFGLKGVKTAKLSEAELKAAQLGALRAKDTMKVKPVIVKKKRRRNLVKKEIRAELKRHAAWTVRREPFERIVREMAEQHNPEIRFQADAFDVFYEDFNKFGADLCYRMAQLARHSGRETIQPKDLHLALDILGASSLRA
jgi:histone H3